MSQGLEKPLTAFQQEEALQTALKAALCSAVPGLCSMPKHVSFVSNKPAGGQLELPAVPANDLGGVEGSHGSPESVFSEASAEPAASGGLQELPGMVIQSGTAPGMAGGLAAAPDGVEAEAGKASAVIEGALGEVPFGAKDVSVRGAPLQPAPVEGSRAGEATAEVRCSWPCLGIQLQHCASSSPWPPAMSAAACAEHSEPRWRAVLQLLLKGITELCCAGAG